MKYILHCLFAFMFVSNVQAQKFSIRVKDQEKKMPLQGVSISEGKKNLGITDSTGVFVAKFSFGEHILEFSAIGFEKSIVTIKFPLEADHVIELTTSTGLLEEITIVSSTRNNQRIENSPLKVEVLGREEMDEENAIKPASIGSIIGDISGIQIQQSSAVNGNANVRIQGLEGRYTQILRDGLPLYDGFSGGFGILSIPPLDLKQVELIKGAASTLYGGGAIGGMVNIISRKPTEKQVATLTLNRSTLSESNINAFLSKKHDKIGYTLYAGYTNQGERDVNKDGFSDLPKLVSLVVHPRLFLYPSKNTTITAGYTGTFEKRNGGDMMVLKGNGNTYHQYYEENQTKRNSGEFIIEHTYSDKTKLEFKNSLSSFNRKLISNTFSMDGQQFNQFSELSVFHPYKKGSVVGGINLLGDQFKKLSSSFPIALQNFSNNTFGFFAQNTLNLTEQTILEAGIREDLHNHYGNFLLPRVALFHRFNDQWATRGGIGYGYKAPNLFSSQIKDVPIEKILPFTDDIKAEKSIGYNVEVNYKKEWGDGNEFFINHAFFLTSVNNPIIIENDALGGNILFANANKPVVTKGFDTYIQTVLNGFEVYVGYTFTIAERKYLNTNQFMPLTPKNRMAFTLLRDFEKLGFRVGAEASYNGKQIRYDGSKTPGYLFAAAMLEKRLGKKIRLVLNCENLFDYRQSRIESLFNGSIMAPDFKPLWAPIDGRVVNLAMVVKL